MTQAQESSLQTRTQKWKAAKWNRMFVERAVIESKAWLTLKTATACQVYMIFLAKCRWEKVQGKAAKSRKGAYVHTNNGAIQFTYREALEKWGITEGKFLRAIEALFVVGLIDITASPMGLHKEVSLYAISERWRAWGTPGFEWKLRQPRPERIGFERGNQYGRNCTKKGAAVADNSCTTVTDNS